MQTIHTKAGFKVLRESLGLYQSDVAEAADVDVKTVKNWESPRLPRARATAVAWKYLENLAESVSPWGRARAQDCAMQLAIMPVNVSPWGAYMA